MAKGLAQTPTDGRVVLEPSAKTMGKHLKAWGLTQEDLATLMSNELGTAYPPGSARNILDGSKPDTDKRRRALQRIYNRYREAEYPEDHPAIKKRDELQHVIRACSNALAEEIFAFVMPRYAADITARFRPKDEGGAAEVPDDD